MEERAALVTGGGRGIGRAIVERLVGDGWGVAFTWRSDEGAARELEASLSGKAHAFLLDVCDPGQVSAVIAEVEGSVGPLVGLVNNAGVQLESLLAMTSDAEWEATLETNLGGVFRCCRSVLPGMIRRRHGSIVNLSSLSGIHGRPGQAAYAASKAGVLGLTRSLSREVGKRGVRVNAVLPGFVPTDLPKSLPEGVVESLRSMESLRTGTSPAEVADAVAFLLSDRATAITGQTLVVDAGASA